MRAGVWHRDTISWMIAAAALPAAAAAIGAFGPVALWHMVLTLIVVIAWQLVFLWARAQPVSPIALVTAIAVGILAPGDFAPWQIVLAASFGTVIGEQVFGGWGRNIVNSAVATLAFLFFAFPQTDIDAGGLLLAFAVLPGALLLMATGILSWQIVISSIIGSVLVSVVLGHDPLLIFTQGSLMFGLVFLVGDPVASSATRIGRWAYGFGAGALLALFGWRDTGFDGPQAIIFATLVVSLFAPLIDAAVIAAIKRSWRPRNG
ncbi:RnfABCDGE type electron transport complex subunit D [Pelagibacterium flavum]|uniref:RnfABCDGE type electron transport complex subunit D n=1 Tax=Pelagibacterium flavum TaxID=2984530 RepID=A0ABY6IUZ5_9HYPH|nr:RnfABCDGE type electron transport complex subunit D [Pelagibacterium sp. YIM 151497]UYQ70850.1 RnfABCDGE type electron transport complex subunit D [Pelagibacterium sp. YIM 151497]UYQ73505.1 RnfABCDGE type electron transport complex subunit D [Pelagibacterium sp. YIM 151497]